MQVRWQLSLSVHEIFQTLVQHHCPVSAHLPSTAHTELSRQSSAGTQRAGSVRTTPRLSSAVIPLTGKNPTPTRRIPLISSHISTRRVCVHVCVILSLAVSGDWADRQLLELSALSLSAPCLSRIPLQWGESTVERKPITRSIPPDPRRMPNGQVFPHPGRVATRWNSDT